MSVCQAVHERKELTHAIERAFSPGQHKQVHELQGSEAELLLAFEHLMGVVAEYTDGGDQMAEGCTCLNGSNEQHRHQNGSNSMTFMQMLNDHEYKGYDIP